MSKGKTIAGSLAHNAGPEQRFDLARGAMDIRSLLAPDAIEFKRSDFNLGNKYCRSLLLSTYSRQVYFGWLDSIINGLGDIDYSVHIEPIPDRTVLDVITRKLSMLEAQRSIDAKKGNIYSLPQLTQAINDLEQIREAIYTNQDRMYYITTTFTLYADSLEELDSQTNNIQSALAMRSSKVRLMIYRQEQAFKTTLPLGQNALAMRRNATLGGVMSMMPFTGVDFSHSQGTLFGVNPFSGAPIFYDPFIGAPELSNPHMLCLGYTGSGKTVTIFTKALRSMLALQPSILIDPESKQIAHWVKAVGGTVIDLDTYRETQFNLFEIGIEEDPEAGARVNIMDKIADIRAVLGLIAERQTGQNLSAEELVLIEEAVQEIYAARGITADPASLYEADRVELRVAGRRKDLPTITDFQACLESMEGASRIANLVKPMLRGGSLGMFDGQSTVDIENESLICIDVHRIRDDFTRLYVMTVILGWIWTRFTLRYPKLPKHVFIDESWMFVRFKDTAEHLENLGRRARKYMTGLNIASQSFREFAHSEQGKAIVQSCATSLLLNPHSDQLEDLREIYRLSEGATQYLSACSSGNGLLLSERTVVPFYNQLIPAELDLFFG